MVFSPVVNTALNVAIAGSCGKSSRTVIRSLSSSKFLLISLKFVLSFSFSKSLFSPQKSVNAIGGKLLRFLGTNPPIKAGSINTKTPQLPARSDATFPET